MHMQSWSRVRQVRGISSAGRAPALQAGCHRFDPGILHFRGKHIDKNSAPASAGVTFRRFLPAGGGSLRRAKVPDKRIVLKTTSKETVTWRVLRRPASRPG